MRISNLRPPSSALPDCALLYFIASFYHFCSFLLHQKLSLPSSDVVRCATAQARLRAWLKGWRKLTSLNNLPDVRPPFNTGRDIHTEIDPTLYRAAAVSRGAEETWSLSVGSWTLVRIVAFGQGVHADSYGSQLVVRGFMPTVSIDRRSFASTTTAGCR